MLKGIQTFIVLNSFNKSSVISDKKNPPQRVGFNECCSGVIKQPNQPISDQHKGHALRSLSHQNLRLW